MLDCCCLVVGVVGRFFIRLWVMWYILVWVLLMFFLVWVWILVCDSEDISVNCSFWL